MKAASAMMVVALALGTTTCAIRRTHTRSSATVTRSGRPASSTTTTTTVEEEPAAEGEPEAEAYETEPEVEAETGIVPEPEPETEHEGLGIVDDRPAIEVLEGRASFYADRFHGRPTASGEPYDMHALTAASRDLPFGTIVRVIRVETGASVVVRVNDRGPFRDHSRILDLSRAAAEELDMVRAGVVDIRAEILERGDGARWHPDDD